MRADHAIWILTANSIDELPDSIVDRLTVFSIPEPDPDARKTIIRHIYAATNARFKRAFESELEQAIVDQLIAYNQRTIGKLLRLAFGFAAEDARRQLLVEDVTKACAVVEWATKEPVGFFVTSDTKTLPIRERLAQRLSLSLPLTYCLPAKIQA